MAEPTTYILFSGYQYYPEGGAGDKTTVIQAEDDDAAMEQARNVDPSRLTWDWWRLDKIERDQLVPVCEGWAGDHGVDKREVVEG